MKRQFARRFSFAYINLLLLLLFLLVKVISEFLLLLLLAVLLLRECSVKVETNITAIS